jgi:putative DNA primase/helicase
LSKKPKPAAKAKGPSRRLVLSPNITRPTAEEFVNRHYRQRDSVTIRYWAGRFYAWHGRHYEPIDDLTLKRQVLDFLTGCVTEKGAPFPANDATVRGAVEALKCLYHVESDTAVPCWLDGGEGRQRPDRLVVLRNGLLDVETRQLQPHDPGYFCVNGVDYDFLPATPPPARWLKFLDSLFGDDGDDGQIRLLQQWLGYLVVPDNSFEKALIAIGPTRSGKGTIARVAENLVGLKNVAGPTTSSLASPFGLAQLVGKLLAILGDARFTGTGSSVLTERLLSVIGNDLIEVDRKHRDSVSVVIGTRFMVLTNETPQFNDASTALAKRFLVLKLTKSFDGREDTKLKKDLLQELPAIFNWALDGYHELKKAERFKQPEASARLAVDLGEMSSPVGVWFAECCEVTAGMETPKAEVFNSWKSWAERNGFEPGNTSTFGRHLSAVWPEMDTKQGTSGKRSYRGLALMV